MSGMEWGHTKQLRNARCLMAVERQLTRELLITALKMAGAGQILSGTGSDMLREVQTFKPDVIFAEYDMALIDGVDFVRHIRTDFKIETPTVLLIHEGDRKKALGPAKAAGVSGAVIVPFTQDALVKMTRKVLGY
ncbi:MAG: response regulator [Magnetospirillum sp.]|nr:response regulator [Magnetospirillum sp.]